jgi:hypothetical protein
MSWANHNTVFHYNRIYIIGPYKIMSIYKSSYFIQRPVQQSVS